MENQEVRKYQTKAGQLKTTIVKVIYDIKKIVLQRRSHFWRAAGLTGLAAVHREAALLAHVSLAEAQASAQHLAGVRDSRAAVGALQRAAAAAADHRRFRGRFKGQRG